MATRNPIYFGEVEAVQIIGDALQRPEFFVKDGGGNYVSFTGYTVTAILYDAFGVSRATPTVTVATATPPGESSTVTDGKISIFSAPADLPTKQGDYLLVIKKVEDLDATNIETIIRVRYKFEQPYFDN